MNFTELARRLKISPNELHDILPELGFDIGRKAIKIDDRQAFQIIQQWSSLRAAWDRRKRDDARAREAVERAADGSAKEILIPPFITVRELAELLKLPVSRLIGELMKNGILASLNERLDYETASIIAEDIGFAVKPSGTTKESIEDASDHAELAKKLRAEGEGLEARPPVVVVMGHVDHGKTTLLDAIRETNVAAKESGGITQHIGAYQVEKKGRLITFIDTPGHEAFTTMRSRGARVADIAILVVAADDGFQPQTEEALKIIRSVGMSLIVAINKIDRDNANIDRVKQELAAHDLSPEDWGGKTPVALISAKKREGIDELLDLLLLVADVDAQKIRANPNRSAIGTVIESNMTKNEGPVATVLIQAGTMKGGDALGIKGIYYGKVRALRDYAARNVDEAKPGMPVRILGLKGVPQVGDIMEVAPAESLTKIKLERAAEQELNVVAASSVAQTEQRQGNTLPLIIKADVLGSLEAILLSLEKFNTAEVGVAIVSKGLGHVNDSDVLQAQATGATIYAFNVTATPQAAALARDRKVTINFSTVIYKLLKEIREKLEALLKPEVIITNLGKMQVLAVFRTDKKGQVVGGKLSEGRVTVPVEAIVYHKGEQIARGHVDELRVGKEKVTDVTQGQEFGIRFEGDPVIQAEDIIEFASIQERKRTLGA